MFVGILREFGEILGKYRMLDLESVGSKGLSHDVVSAISIDLNSWGITTCFNVIRDVEFVIKSV